MEEEVDNGGGFAFIVRAEIQVIRVGFKLARDRAEISSMVD